MADEMHRSSVQPSPSSVKRPRCPKCRSTNLTAIETYEVFTSWDGPFCITEDGGIATEAEVGYHETGSILRADMNCADCGHGWKPRRNFEGSLFMPGLPKADGPPLDVPPCGARPAGIPTPKQVCVAPAGHLIGTQPGGNTPGHVWQDLPESTDGAA